MTHGANDYVLRARSFLFVPGYRPDRFAKAAASGADGIVLDLEDSVGPDRKEAAREHVREWLAAGHPGVVRINSSDTPWYDDDVAMVSDHSCVVMLPKVIRVGDVTDVVSRLAEGSTVMAILETAESILSARTICAAPGVVRAIFGNADLGSELGVDPGDQTALAFARAQTVFASAAAGLVPPVDGATTAITDDKVAEADALHALAMGFTGKACLHPRQVPIINAVLTPSPEDVRWARSVLAAVGDGSIGTVDGEVVGKPIFERARRTLERAGL